MTSLLKTIPIIHFIMKSFGPFSNQEVGQCQLEVDPLPLQMTGKAWMTMAIQTGDLVMRGGPPGLHILLHIMTEATKRRAL